MGGNGNRFRRRSDWIFLGLVNREGRRLMGLPVLDGEPTKVHGV
jgi:hypothetical protein